ncbi:hypothetical protein [Hyphococcus sp.]|uniref:hypothetical protein n=1 Tax=Hyphococcus sp. TaxID=2038636 RepID=UPI003CCC15E0
MAEAAQKRIQPDVTRAFSIDAQRTFFRANDQVYAIVGVNRDLNLVSDVWFDRFDTQDEFRAVIDYICDLFRTGAFRYWLADLRFLRSSFDASEAWLVNDVMPAVIEAGLEREAVVLPDAAVDREGEDAYASGSRALREIADGRVRGFTDVALARRWLLDGALPEDSNFG